MRVFVPKRKEANGDGHSCVMTNSMLRTCLLSLACPLQAVDNNGDNCLVDVMSCILYICTVVSEKFAAPAIRAGLPCSCQALVEGHTSDKVSSFTVSAVTMLITIYRILKNLRYIIFAT